MYRRTIFLLFMSVFISVTGFSQTINENIDKRIKDPKTAENAAKADVYIVKNKSTIDTLQRNDTPSPGDRKKKLKKSGNKKKKQ